MFQWRRVFKLTLWKLVMVNKTRSPHLPKILYWSHLRQDLLRPGKNIKHNSVSKKTSAKHEVQFTAHQKMNASHSATVLFAYLPIYCLALKKNINSNRTTLQYLSNHPEKKQWHLSKHTQKSLITSQQVRLLVDKFAPEIKNNLFHRNNFRWHDFSQQTKQTVKPDVQCPNFNAWNSKYKITNACWVHDKNLFSNS